MSNSPASSPTQGEEPVTSSPHQVEDSLLAGEQERSTNEGAITSSSPQKENEDTTVEKEDVDMKAGIAEEAAEKGTKKECNIPEKDQGAQDAGPSASSPTASAATSPGTLTVAGQPESTESNDHPAEAFIQRHPSDDNDPASDSEKNPDNAEKTGTTKLPPLSIPHLNGATQPRVQDEGGRELTNDPEAQLRAKEAELETALRIVRELEQERETMEIGREKEQIDFEASIKSKEEHEDLLYARIKKLEEKLLRANDRQALMNMPVDRLLSEQSAQAEKAKMDIDALKRRQRGLIAEVESKSNTVARLDAQLMEGLSDTRQEQVTGTEIGINNPPPFGGSSTGILRETYVPESVSREQARENRMLLTELRKTRDALKDHKSYLWRARSEIHRLQLDRFSTANEFVDYYGNVLDPYSQIFKTMRGVANYCDGIDKEPAPDVTAELDRFQRFLGERTQLLRDIMDLEDPTELLEKFDEKWGQASVDNDWGSILSRNAMAVRATVDLKLQKPGKGVGDLLQAEKTVQERFGHDFNDEVTDKVVDLQDDLRRKKKAQGGRRASRSSTSSR